jgi:hypothetical protein
MSDELLIKYFQSLHWIIEIIKGKDNQDYMVIHNYQIKSGDLAGRVCDLAIQMTKTVPYVPPRAIHTNPALVKMDMNLYRTQNSGIGPEWQYWSRVFQHTQAPKAFVAHIATIFSEVKL